MIVKSTTCSVNIMYALLLRDLVIWRCFEENPVVWDVMEFLSTGRMLQIVVETYHTLCIIVKSPSVLLYTLQMNLGWLVLSSNQQLRHTEGNSKH